MDMKRLIIKLFMLFGCVAFVFSKTGNFNSVTVLLYFIFLCVFGPFHMLSAYRQRRTIKHWPLCSLRVFVCFNSFARFIFFLCVFFRPSSQQSGGMLCILMGCISSGERFICHWKYRSKSMYAYCLCICRAKSRDRWN